MIVSIIAAVAENKVIGKDNDLIWNLPKDMKFFMDTTLNHYVIMGRRNYDSIPEKYRPLKNRTNVIVTRQKDFSAPDCVVTNSIEEGIQNAKENGDDECFVIGGGQIYNTALENSLVDRMYLTHIKESFDGDTYFPDFNENDWNQKIIMEHHKDEKNPHDFIVVQYDRKNS